MKYLPSVCAVNIVGSLITTCAFNVSVFPNTAVLCVVMCSFAELLEQLVEADPGQGLEDVTIAD